MTAESLGHIFIFIGIMATWLFPLWLYFHWLIDDDNCNTEYIIETYRGHFYECKPIAKPISKQVIKQVNKQVIKQMNKE